MTHAVVPLHQMGCAVAALASATDVTYNRALHAVWPKGRPKKALRYDIPGFGKYVLRPDHFPGVVDLNQIESALLRLGFRGRVRINGELQGRTGNDSWLWGMPEGQSIFSPGRFKPIDVRSFKRVTLLSVKESNWIWMHSKVWDPAAGGMIDIRGGHPYYRPLFYPRSNETYWSHTNRHVFWYCEIERLDGRAIRAFDVKGGTAQTSSLAYD